ncbi:MAG TPA: flagellar motor stator protein MotA [Vicinamibacterales bacterium]
MLLIVGAILVFASVLTGYLMEGGNLLVLKQPSELIIIGGAALGSLLISTPVKVVKQLIGQIKGLLGKGLTKDDFLELLAMQYQLFRLSQQSGVMSLEAHFEEPEKSSILSTYPKFLAKHHAVDFLADSVKVIIIGGISPHDLESLMDEDLQVNHDEETKPANILSKVGDALPGFGIVAAVLGVVITMGAIDGPATEIGKKVAAALVGTFLGILMSYGFVAPMSTNLEQQAQDHGRYTQCIKAGLLASYKGFPPAIAVEFARRVLPADVRPTFNQTEERCRAAGRAAEKEAA